MLSVQGNRRRDRALCPLALALEAQSDSRGGPRHRCCKPVWLPCRACGMEQVGGEKRGRAWAAGGRGLQPPRAAAAAAQPALFAPRSDSGAHCAGTRAPPRGRRCSSARGRDAAKLRRAGEQFRVAGALAAARCSVWPEDWRGRKGKAGTHTCRGARALHTRSCAPPPRRVRGECGPAAPAPAPASSQLYCRPRPRPADPRDPGLHCCPLARGKQQHPGNLQTVAQLVSKAEAPECCPSEVSFLRVPDPSFPGPSFWARAWRGSVSLMNPGGLYALTLSALCWGSGKGGACGYRSGTFLPLGPRLRAPGEHPPTRSPPRSSGLQ